MRFHPSFPRPDLLPWLLLAAAAALIAIGLIGGDRQFTGLGVLALLVAGVAFPFARLLLGRPDAAEGDGEDEGTT